MNVPEDEMRGERRAAVSDCWAGGVCVCVLCRFEGGSFRDRKMVKMNEYDVSQEIC